MGVGATDTFHRMATSLGQLNEAPIQFQRCEDVPNAGVLVALPALIIFGLLDDLDNHFTFPKGYYGIGSLFLLLALMALARYKTVDSLRFSPPGEWGKLLGLDRAPEVRTLREKIKLLSSQGKSEQWLAHLAQRWMSQAPQDAAVFYCDGHVRVYHGNQTQLPKHYVSRERLCLRATTDYWLNAMDGQPFLVVNKAIDPGLIKVLEHDIVPSLEEMLPNKSSDVALGNDPLQHQFTLVFDREGYSPDFFLKMKQKRIACITYHKYQGDDWPKEEFSQQTLTLQSGLTVTTAIAERGTLLSNKIWVREIRKLTTSGRQVAVVSTQYRGDAVSNATSLFNRWSQENFFKYMLEHYNLDRLITYSLDDIPDTTRVVNPSYRALDSNIRSLNGKLSRKQAMFGQLSLSDEIESKKVEQYQQDKAVLLEDIHQLQQQIETLKNQRKQEKRHIEFKDLPENEQFKALASDSKYLLDTIKMIAYRSETALQQILAEKLKKKDQARQLARAIYQSSADLIPDESNNVLTIKLHHQANPMTNHVVQYMCDELNKTESIFPGTNLKLVYKLGST